MGSNRKQAQMERKAYFERQLKDRRTFLSEKGIETSKINKDTILKKLRANIDAINVRLKTIANFEKRTEELAKAKADKAAAPNDPEASKEKKAKEVPLEGKKKKKEKSAS